MGLGGTRGKGRPEDQCYKDKADAYWYQTWWWCVDHREADWGAEQVPSIGSIVSKKGATDEDIQARIGKARQAFGMLRTIWGSTVLTTKTKLRIFRPNVKAVLLYGSETWRQTKVSEQKLQVSVNKNLRNILRIWWPRRIHNEELWRQAEQWPVVQEISQRA